MSYNIGGTNYSGYRYYYAGSPVAGTSEVQTITFGGTPTGGTFTLTFNGYTTAAISWSSTNSTLVANIDAALGALASVNGAANVTTAVGTMTSGIGTITVTFAGELAKKNVPLMTSSSSLTGTSPTLAVATTTAGVDTTHRGAPIGATLQDTTNGVLYINTGTAIVPTWTVAGTQT
jgi:hypothetical protein